MTEVNTLKIPEGVQVIHDLVYARTANKDLLLDLYLPQDTKLPRPLIVYLHGGGWAIGDRKWCEEALGLLQYGFAVASVEYRLSDEAPFPAQIRDSKAAVRWLRSHAHDYDLDPNRFGAMGASAGGMLAALVGLCPEKTAWDQGPGEYLEHAEGISSAVKAVSDWCGVTDLPHLYDPFGDLQMENIDDLIIPFLGGNLSEKKDMAYEASPLYYVSPDAPPFLLVHGDQDNLVSPNQAISLHEALRAKGVAATLVMIPGAGHGDDGDGFVIKEVVEKSKNFFLACL